MTNDEKDDKYSLASDIETSPKNILEIEGVGYETEGVDSDNEGVVNEVLPPERKGYIPRNLPNINYSDKRSTWICIGWNNLIVSCNEIHSFAKAYVNVNNDITSFFKPTPPTNITTNKTILKQYIINQGLKVFGKKFEAAV